MKHYQIGKYKYKQITEEEFVNAHEEYSNNWEYFSSNYYYFAEGFDGEPLIYFKRVRISKQGGKNGK